MIPALSWAAMSHFNVSVESDGQSHRTVSTNHNLFEEKGELQLGIEPTSLATQWLYAKITWQRSFDDFANTSGRGDLSGLERRTRD